MQTPLQVVFNGLDHSDAVEEHIRDSVEKLEQYSDDIVGCRVVVERRHHSHRKGNLFHVLIELSLPKRQLVVNREPQDRHAHEDVLVTLRDAFNAARRRLKRRVQRRRGKIKSHDSPPHGRIARLFPNEDFGFIAASDGQEIYFHRNSVVEGSFDALDVGSEVRYTESTGDEGPQASTVKPIGKHHIVS